LEVLNAVIVGDEIEEGNGVGELGHMTMVLLTSEIIFLRHVISNEEGNFEIVHVYQSEVRERETKVVTRPDEREARMSTTGGAHCLCTNGIVPSASKPM
jgi:hypothetical protein